METHLIDDSPKNTFRKNNLIKNTWNRKIVKHTCSIQQSLLMFSKEHLLYDSP